MTTLEQIRKESTAAEPDLDWSQVRETVRLLQLSMAQIDKAMEDGESSVTSLGDSLVSIIGKVKGIEEAAAEISGEGEINDTKNSIETQCQSVNAQVQQAVIAFQFYDKLSQRLSNVTHGLQGLAELVSDSGRLYSPDEWAGLQTSIRSRYTMKEEQDMFDALLNGSTVEDALNNMSASTNNEVTADDDSIELF